MTISREDYRYERGVGIRSLRLQRNALYWAAQLIPQLNQTAFVRFKRDQLASHQQRLVMLRHAYYRGTD
jgi:hypothetical protein